MCLNTWSPYGPAVLRGCKTSKAMLEGLGWCWFLPEFLASWSLRGAIHASCSCCQSCNSWLCTLSPMNQDREQTTLSEALSVWYFVIAVRKPADMWLENQEEMHRSLELVCERNVDNFGVVRWESINVVGRACWATLVLERQYVDVNMNSKGCSWGFRKQLSKRPLMLHFDKESSYVLPMTLQFAWAQIQKQRTNWLSSGHCKTVCWSFQFLLQFVCLWCATVGWLIVNCIIFMEEFGSRGGCVWREIDNEKIGCFPLSFACESQRLKNKICV